jgi:hypothetical protein
MEEKLVAQIDPGETGRVDHVPWQSKPINVLDIQIGGAHYKSYTIQPIEFFIANQIPYAEAAVIKYVMRHRHKGGAEDLKKARHIIDILLEKEYATE